MIPEKIYSKIHALMPIACVDLVVWREGQVLVLKRKDEPLRGGWFVPGGRVLRDEHLSYACARIVRDEACLESGFPRFVGYDETMFDTDPFHHGKGTHTVNLIFAVPGADGRVKLSSRHSAYQWLEPYEIVRNSDYHPYIRRIVQKAQLLEIDI